MLQKIILLLAIGLVLAVPALAAADDEAAIASDPAAMPRAGRAVALADQDRINDLAKGQAGLDSPGFLGDLGGGFSIKRAH